MLTRAKNLTYVVLADVTSYAKTTKNGPPFRSTQSEIKYFSK